MIALGQITAMQAPYSLEIKGSHTRVSRAGTGLLVVVVATGRLLKTEEDF